MHTRARHTSAYGVPCLPSPSHRLRSRANQRATRTIKMKLKRATAFTAPCAHIHAGSSYLCAVGLETEATGDSTGSYDLSNVSPGSYVVCRNVD